MKLVSKSEIDQLSSAICIFIQYSIQIHSIRKYSNHNEKKWGGLEKIPFTMPPLKNHYFDTHLHPHENIIPSLLYNKCLSRKIKHYSTFGTYLDENWL
jgi:hypothetical protein